MPVPCPVSFSEKVKFKLVSCGAFHTVALSETGDPFACGLVSNGRLGLTEEQARESMRSAAGDLASCVNDGSPVLNLHQLTKVPLSNEIQGQSRVIASAHCGYDYTLLLTSTGLLLSAGSGQWGIHCNFQNQQATPDTMGATADFSKGVRDLQRDTRSTLSTPGGGGPLDQFQFR